MSHYTSRAGLQRCADAICTAHQGLLLCAAEEGVRLVMPALSAAQPVVNILAQAAEG